MSEQEKAYWTAEVAKMLDTSPASINRWTRALEDLGFPIIAGTEGRAYTQKDIDVLKKIQEIMSNGPKTKTSDAARKALGLDPEQRYVEDDRTRSSRNQAQSSEHDRLNNQVIERERSSDLAIAQAIEAERMKMAAMFEKAQSFIAELEDKVIDLEDRLEKQDMRHRLERVDVWSIRTEVRQQLKKEAETAWQSLPDTERKHKVLRGFFPKTVENEEKKHWFISEYVNDRIDEEVARRIAEKQEETVIRRGQKYIDS